MTMQNDMQNNIDTQQATLRVTMLPRDTNSYGIIFGGIILSHIDLAGATQARRYKNKNFVTVAMKEVKFLSPVYVGDVVSLYTGIVAIGKTSVTIRVQVKAERQADGFKTVVDVTEATVVYVAIDKDHQPVLLDA